MNITLFKDSKFIFALPEHGGIRSGVSVLVQGHTIKRVDTYTNICREDPNLVTQADVIDCSNKIVMPGLVDAHNHLCNTHMNLSRIVGINYDDIVSHMMATVHDPYGWLTEESLYDISMASLVNGMKQGATTIENSTIMPEVAHSAMRDAGIRGILAGQIATSFRLEPDDLNWKEMLARTERNIKAFHDPEKGMSVVIHVHDLWDTVEEVMHQGLRLAEEYDTQYVTHFWEFNDAIKRADEIFAAEGGAMNHYLNLGLVNDRCVLFHGSMLNETEIDQLAGTGASVIHNPDINGTNCGNCAYIPYMLDKGINVGLGSDYGSLDVKTAMKLMLLVHNIMPRKHKGIAPHVPFEAATMGGARAYGLDKLIGSIEPGKRADLFTIDMAEAPQLLPMSVSVIEYDPSILYFLFTRNAAGTPTSELMIDGVMKRRNGEFTQLDEEAIVAKAAHWMERFIPDLLARHREGHHYTRTVHPDFALDQDIDWEAIERRYF